MASSSLTRRRTFVRIDTEQVDGIVRGKATPGAEIEAVNLSIGAAERIRPNEAVIIARADARGRFAGTLPMRRHDLVRVRACTPAGASRWTTFRVRGIAGEPRPIHVAIRRLGLRDLGNGSVKVFNINPKLAIAEPGTVLWIDNERTGHSARLVMNVVGGIEGRATIPGSAGDTLVIRTAADTVRAARTVGKLLTPSPRPPRDRGRAAVVHPSGQHQRLGFVPTLRRFRAPLFARRPRALDVVQSELPNCFIAGAASAIAQIRPDCIERAIVRTGHGTYRVRFRMKNPRTGRYEARDIEVTSDLYVRPSGELLYGSTPEDAEGDAPRALWWPLLEKAFARLRGSYRKIGRGGCSDRILELMLGRPPKNFFLDRKDPEHVWREITSALEAKRPVVAATASPSAARRYRNTGLIADHAYAVLSARERRGRLRIGVRNPWGEDAKRPHRVRKNGVIEMDFDEFMRLFQLVTTVR